MSDELKQLAIAYFQDSLSKFCPADKDRPNGYEIDMFVAGYSFCDIKLTKAEDKIQELKAENARHIERIKELTTELEFYKNRVNKTWGEE